MLAKTMHQEESLIILSHLSIEKFELVRSHLVKNPYSVETDG